MLPAEPSSAAVFDRSPRWFVGTSSLPEPAVNEPSIVFAPKRKRQKSGVHCFHIHREAYKARLDLRVGIIEQYVEALRIAPALPSTGFAFHGDSTRILDVQIVHGLSLPGISGRLPGEKFLTLPLDLSQSPTVSVGSNYLLTKGIQDDGKALQMILRMRREASRNIPSAHEHEKRTGIVNLCPVCHHHL